ncbi:1-deoxy-D-xylulose-5-phosphate reductoisomerase [Falsiroseomonas sp.]|uniref:1-deoxy-D-xylulose-5-phosphate reductoisomerase n=1 Tax=Falsiroseomonas sp. TaxID=2870721 RepID=UPI0034A56FCF
MTRSVSILGATGSIGRSTMALMDAAEPGAFRIEALVANKDVPTLAAQALRLRPRVAVVADPGAYAALKDALGGRGIELAAGPDAVVDAAARPADWTMAAIVGAAGLRSTLAALARGGTLALANKESLVCAAELVMDAARQGGATLLPVDSEHNAIFQCLHGDDPRGIDRIVLTASGGPFRDWTLDQMARVTPEQALKHPTWSMGAKISIDSATMMNKGLEVIEAARLFALPSARIDVLVHPQSAVHGMVHYADGSILAQLGSPDMRTPIAHALAWPRRMRAETPRLDLAALAKLEFFAPDPIRFPALRLAREALMAGGGAPTILNAANETAVALFLDRRLRFLDIATVVAETMASLAGARPDGLEAILALDAEARLVAGRLAEARVALA